MKYLGKISNDKDLVTKEWVEDKNYLTSAPVSSVNNKTGAVSLTASDINALPDTTTIPSKTSQLTNDSNYITQESINNFIKAEDASTEAGTNPINADTLGGYTASQYAKVSDVPTKVSELTNDASYVNASAVPTTTSELTNDSGYITSSVLSSYATIESLSAYAPKASPTFTGTPKVSANTAYTTAQLRNVIISTASPSGGSNGDIWIKYSN